MVRPRRHRSVLRVVLGLLVIALVVAFDPANRGPALVVLAVLGAATVAYLTVTRPGGGRGRGPGRGPRPRG